MGLHSAISNFGIERYLSTRRNRRRGRRRERVEKTSKIRLLQFGIHNSHMHTAEIDEELVEVINSSCFPQSVHTYLFAYSNDLDPQIVKDSINDVISTVVNGNYLKFGSIRFDTKIAGKFHFFKDLESLQKSVNSNLPHPSLGFSNNLMGSDILDILQRFLENTDGVPLCGAQIIIALKRHPLEIDTSNLLARLRYHRIFIKTGISNTPILGENYQVMYNLSGLTNGIAAFVNDQLMHWVIRGYTSALYDPFQIYSINPICKSGIERTDFPMLRIPKSEYTTVEIRFEISLQDHGPFDKFRLLNLTLTNSMNHTDQMNVYADFNNDVYTNIFREFQVSQDAKYSVKLVTEFLDSIPENLQIRIQNKNAPINWFPFTNYN